MTSDLWSTSIDRRRFLGVSGAAAAAALFPFTGRAASTPAGAAYGFLRSMMDLYAGGTTPRLLQSYLGGTTSAYVYDNALAMLAFLRSGVASDITRAGLIGQALLAAMAREQDGRLRSAYDASGFASGHITPTNSATTTGNMAWAGIALFQLAWRTGGPYAAGAGSIANWLTQNTMDGGNGFRGGFDSTNTPYAWKSTEHNIDAYGFFNQISLVPPVGTNVANQTGSAQGFIGSMWNGQYFWVGTDNNGNINRYPMVEDVQSWSYLALQNVTWASSIDFTGFTLRVRNAPPGVSYSSADRSGIWYEGTAHMAAALQARNYPNDPGQARAYLATIESSQTPSGGINAASRPLQTGEGDTYPVLPHVGATSWYLLAKARANPLI